MTTTAVDALIGLGRLGAVDVFPDRTRLVCAVERLDAAGARFLAQLMTVCPETAAVEPLLAPSTGHGDSNPRVDEEGQVWFLSDRICAGEPPEGQKPPRRKQVWVLKPEAKLPLQITDAPLGVTAFDVAGSILVCVAPLVAGVPWEEQRERETDRRSNGPSGLLFRRQPTRFWDHWLGPDAPHLLVYDRRGTLLRDLCPDSPVDLVTPSFHLSGDGKRVAWVEARPASDRLSDDSVVVFDVASGERLLTLHTDRASWAGPRLDADGSHLLATLHRRVPGECGRPDLHVVDVATHHATRIAEDWDRWPEPVGFAPDGRAIVLARHNGGCGVFALEPRPGAPVMPWTAPGGTWEAAWVRGDTLVAQFHGLLQPPVPALLPLPGPGPARPSRVFSDASASLLGDSTPLVAGVRVERLSVPAGDGCDIDTFLLHPPGDQGPRPTLLWVHGGPISQWSDWWHWRWNPLAFVAAGYRVALPNPRGSTGYGQAFIEGVWGNTWGDRCARDVLAVADHLDNRPDVDSKRMAAMGGSFGGWMVNYLGGTTQRFAAIVSHAGIYSHGNFHGTTDVPPYWALHMGQAPYADPADHDRWSPSRNIGAWRTPTLITHGQKDERVPIGEGLSLFEGLLYHGVDAELLVFPDENHWILKPRNARLWHSTVLAFLARTLG
jgi:dipeptidyl aminopeptidase/acylaminoacyl peptidase